VRESFIDRTLGLHARQCISLLHDQCSTAMRCRSVLAGIIDFEASAVRTHFHTRSVKRLCPCSCLCRRHLELGFLGSLRKGCAKLGTKPTPTPAACDVECACGTSTSLVWDGPNLLPAVLLGLSAGRVVDFGFSSQVCAAPWSVSSSWRQHYLYGGSPGPSEHHLPTARQRVLERLCPVQWGCSQAARHMNSQ
jgi:hypothetical protein